MLTASPPDRAEDAELRALLSAALADATLTPSPGIQLGGYELRALIGRGSFGTVWRAEERESHESVAIKIFDASTLEPDLRIAAAVRFWLGAVAMSRLRGAPRIISVFYGPSVQNGLIWYSMDHFPDGDLSAAIAADTLSTAERLSVVDDLLTALSALEHAKLVHRDIKPQNILLRRRAGGIEAVLADFDTAFNDLILQRRRSTHGHVGSPKYMPPDVLTLSDEGLKRALRDRRIDLYAVCLVIWELFSGRDCDLPPDRGVGSIRSTLPLSYGRNRPGLTPSQRTRLANICARGLSFAPAVRYTTLSSLNSAWSLLKKEPRRLAVIGGAAIVLLMASAYVVADWACHPWTAGTHWAPIINVVAGLATAAGLTSWVSSSLQASLPAWRRAIGSFLVEHKIVAAGIVGILLSAPILLALKTDLIGRASRPGQSWLAPTPKAVPSIEVPIQPAAVPPPIAPPPPLEPPPVLVPPPGSPGNGGSTGQSPPARGEDIRHPSFDRTNRPSKGSRPNRPADTSEEPWRKPTNDGPDLFPAERRTTIAPSGPNRREASEREPAIPAYAPLDCVSGSVVSTEMARDEKGNQYQKEDGDATIQCQQSLTSGELRLDQANRGEYKEWNLPASGARSVGIHCRCKAR